MASSLFWRFYSCPSPSVGLGRVSGIREGMPPPEYTTMATLNWEQRLSSGFLGFSLLSQQAERGPCDARNDWPQLSRGWGNVSLLPNQGRQDYVRFIGLHLSVSMSIVKLMEKSGQPNKGKAAKNSGLSGTNASSNTSRGALTNGGAGRGRGHDGRSG